MLFYGDCSCHSVCAATGRYHLGILLDFFDVSWNRILNNNKIKWFFEQAEF